MKPWFRLCGTIYPNSFDMNKYFLLFDHNFTTKKKN